MTALAACWRFSGRPDAGGQCGRMLEAQRAYGPHDRRIWDGDDVALGRALYRLLPEDDFDAGPVTGGGGRYRLVADLRLDNRDELGAALGIDPAAMRRLADAAVLMRAWEAWGEGAFERLIGDYAFVLWDAQTRQLWLARDPLGQRPLHYHRTDDLIAVASMPKGLHALPEIPRAPDLVRTAEFLALLPETGPRSFFQDISRVEPGHVVTIAPGHVAVRRHWDPTPASIAPWGGGDPLPALDALFDRSVRARMRTAEGAIGTHLSAGLDSGGVTTTAARIAAERGERILAFTAVPRPGYDEPLPPGWIADEGDLAARVAAMHPAIRHHRVATPTGDPLDDIDRDVAFLDRPVLNACNHRWINAVNRSAHEQGVRVILTGAMGNATISYAGLEFLPDLLRTGRIVQLASALRALNATGSLNWKNGLRFTLGPWVPLALWERAMKGRDITRLSDYSAIHPDAWSRLDLARVARERGLDPAYRPRLDAFATRLWALRRFDWGNLGKAALAGEGVDLRDPTADRRIVEFCLSLPMSAFLRDGRRRDLARRLFANRLPAEVLSEPRRGLQAADWHEALGESLDAVRRDIARLGSVPGAAETLDLAAMAQAAADWPKGGWHMPGTAGRYRLALLRGLASGHFLRKASGSNQ